MLNHIYHCQFTYQMKYNDMILKVNVFIDYMNDNEITRKKIAHPLLQGKYKNVILHNVCIYNTRVGQMCAYVCVCNGLVLRVR